MTTTSPETPTAPPQAYDEVVLHFYRQTFFNGTPDVFQLKVRRTPAPLSGGAFVLDVESQLGEFRKIFEAHLQLVRLFMDDSTRENGRTETAVQLGHQLYNLLPAAFRQNFPRLVQQRIARRRGIRLIVEANAGDQADRFLSLPWELLFFHESLVYLTRSPYAIVERRVLDVVQRASPHLHAPYSLIHIISTPATSPIIAPELIRTEREALPTAITPGYYCEVSGTDTFKQLGGVLAEQNDHYHILHFLGHGQMSRGHTQGGPRAHTSRGCLIFTDALNQPEPVTGEQLQHWLYRTPSVQLIVLNACHSGSVAAGNVALEMVHSGFPYVVAMQGEITQKAALAFSATFYPALQAGYSIGHAVALSRVAIAEAVPTMLDWCLPVLYTNAGVDDLPVAESLAERFATWLVGQGETLRFAQHGVLLGCLHLFMSALLWQNNTPVAMPDRNTIVTMTLLHIGLLPLILGAASKSRISDKVDLWSWRTRAAYYTQQSFVVTVMIIASWIGYLLVTHLFLSAGLWNLLSPLARYILFFPSLIWSSLVAYRTLLSTAHTFSASEAIQPTHFRPGNVGISLGAVFFVLMGAWLFDHPLAQLLLAPPYSNLGLGLLCLGFAWILRQEQLQR